MGALLAGSWRQPRGPERAPRSMGIMCFEKNEHHAPWERSWPAAGATPAAQNERHAAWESFLLKKNERRAAWECSWPAAGATPAAQNERHAAWESFCLKKNECHAAWEPGQLLPPLRPRTSATQHGNHFLKKTNATLHGNAPAAQGRPRSDKTKKYCFFIKNIDFSLEKCRFGDEKGVLHYVLRREMAIFRKMTILSWKYV